MNPTAAQIKNAEQHDRFANLLTSVLAQIADIDANTVADPRWPNDAPSWWHDMTRLGYECYRIKARLG